MQFSNVVLYGPLLWPFRLVGLPRSLESDWTRSVNSLLAPTVNLGERLPASAHPFADRINPFLERRTAWRYFKPTSLERIDHLRLIEAQERALRRCKDAVVEFDGRRAIYGIAALPISE